MKAGADTADVLVKVRFSRAPQCLRWVICVGHDAPSLTDGQHPASAELRRLALDWQKLPS